MPQKITKSVKSMVDTAKREIEEIRPADAVKLAGRDDVVLVDLRDPRELRARRPDARRLPCTRGMLEFWIDPESPYYKPRLRRGQEVRVLLRRRPALGARRQDGAGHGAEAGGAHARRLRGLEGSRRADPEPSESKE